MGFGDIIQYISVIIAVWGFLPEYRKLKLNLSYIFWRSLFFISLFLIVLISFRVFSGYYNYITTQYLLCNRYTQLLIDIVFGGNLERATFFMLWMLHVLSAVGIYQTSKLRSGNKKHFLKLINQMIYDNRLDVVTRLIEDDIKYIVQIAQREEKINKFIENFKESITINVLIDGGQSIFISPPLEKKGRVIEFTKKLFGKQIYQIGSYLFNSSNITDYFSNQSLIDYIAHNNEYLGYKIINTVGSSIKGLTEFTVFVRGFLKKCLSNPDSLFATSMSGIDFEPIDLDNPLLIELKRVGKFIDFGKMIDEVFTDVVRKPEYKLLLNDYYYPGNSEYYSNSKLVIHMYRLMRSYLLFDKEELDLGNMPMFMVKELIDITDWKKIQDTTTEFPCATCYLMRELFDIIEEKVDKTDTNYLTLYFGMLNWLLKPNTVLESFKHTMVKSFFYFLCNGEHKEEKKKQLSSFIYENENLKSYFQLNAHDKLTHNLYGENKDILDIITI